MKMRQKRHHRTRPRLYKLSASVPCKPYTARLAGMEFEMDTVRIYISFYAQDADHKTCMKHIQTHAKTLA